MSDEQMGHLLGRKAVRDIYEAKITSGELMVVKTARPTILDNTSYCGICGAMVESYEGDKFKWCPECGAKIVKE